MTRFVAVWLGQLVSLVGSGVTAFALGVWVYETTGDVGELALLAAAAYAPHIVIAPFGGVLADRLSPRLVMLIGDSFAALAAAALVACAHTGVLGPKLAIVLVGLGACASAIQWPAYEVAVVTLVPDTRLGRASGLVELSRGCAQLVAPVIAGALFDVLGLANLLTIDLASFAVALVPLAVVRFPVRTRTPGRPWLREAWRFVAARRGLAAMLALFATTNFTFGVAELVFRPLVLDDGGAWQLGVVFAAVGSGMVSGALAMAAIGDRIADPIAAIVAFQLVEASALAAAGLAAGLLGRCAAAFAYGVVIPLTFGCARVVWQRLIPYELQGRVAALRNAVLMLAIPIGYAAAPAFVYILAPHVVLVAMAVVTAAAALAAFAYPRYREMMVR